MKKYLVKIKSNGRFPCYAFQTVEANNPTEAIVSINNRHLEMGEDVRNRRTVVAVFEQIWNIDPDKM